MREPFDVLAEGLVSENSRENRTAIELFRAGVQSLEARIDRLNIQSIPPDGRVAAARCNADRVLPIRESSGTAILRWSPRTG
jgi:hypothetical protein